MVSSIGQPAIRTLSPDTIPDLLAFFEDEAFRDNTAWSSCYCQCFYEDHSKVDWPARTASENRAQAIQRCAAGAMQGYLAYLDTTVVGWCNAAPRQLLHCLDGEPVAESQRIGCILCFLVSPGARRRGVAKALLVAACDGLRAQGLVFAEANPRNDASGEAANHFGHLDMYLAAGFVPHRADDSDGSVWVRKHL